MSLLKALASNDETIKQETDSVGGGGVVDSGAYLSEITLAYMILSAGEATGLVLHAKTDTGRDLRQTLWVTSGKEKGKKTFYVDKNGEKHFLPGYNMANSICLLTVGKEIFELDTEDKVVNVYSSTAKAEVPTKVPMIMELLGKKIYLGMIKQVVDKTVKDGNGVYVPNGETREENELDKTFRAEDKLTTTEIRAAATEPAFYDTWTKKWVGQVKQKAKGASGTSGAPKAPGAAPGGTAKPTTSLFGKKAA